MENYQILDWDTKILGIPTAKILPASLTTNELENILHELRIKQIKLVFWAATSEDHFSQQAAQQHNGFLADHKVTYWMDLADFNADVFDLSNVHSYAESLPNADLIDLALEIGIRSRFGTDPRISQQQLTAVYKTWLENSTKRLIAKEVLILEKDKRIVGMSTLGEKNQCGDIGLIAINADYRGLHLGTMLVRASQKWCVENNYQQMQVVTQESNIAACKLYEKCGYKIKALEYFYHFWLD